VRIKRREAHPARGRLPGRGGVALGEPSAFGLSAGDVLLAGVQRAAVGGQAGDVGSESFARVRDGLRSASFGVEDRGETFGLWGEGLAAVYFAKAGDLYVACRDDERLETLGRGWGVELSVC
jgi:hypothetical protein